MSLLESPPPQADAAAEEWNSWHRNHSGGPATFWLAKEKAIQWRCPAKVTITLAGVSHKQTLKVEADEPLSAAVIATTFCSAVPDGSNPINPSEIKLKYSSEGIG